nr:Crp/Fnr family transcriptional regulator [uncultured Draconibacterium sp.]
MDELKKQISSYFGLSNERLDEIAALFAETELNKGAYFIKTGQHCNKLSFIKSGFIRVYSKLNDREVTQWIGGKDYFLTELNSFLFDHPARWNIMALTDCKLYTLDKANYRRLKEMVPNWDEIEKKIIAGCFVTLENRIFDQLSLSAEERYNKLFQQNKELLNQVPLQYIASMLGMSPETFSRIRNKQNS